MNKLLHLLLISIILYFLFFQDVKEGFNDNKCENIYDRKECNNKKKHPECYMFENKDGTSECMNFRQKNMECNGILFEETLFHSTIKTDTQGKKRQKCWRGLEIKRNLGRSCPPFENGPPAQGGNVHLFLFVGCILLLI